MRMRSIFSLAALGLIFGAILLSQPVANGVATGDVHRASILIEQLTANSKDLPVQSFDAY